MRALLRDLRLFVPALALAAGTLAQQTWIVDVNGGGHFTEIQAAVLAAAPGDTILVRPGDYRPFGVDRGVRVLADPGTTVARNGHWWAIVYVADIPLGQTVLLRGFDTGSTLGHEIMMRDCAGAVHIEDVTTGSIEPGRCSQVSIVDSTLERIAAWTSTVVVSDCRVGPGDFVGLYCVDSQVVFAESTLVGGQSVSRAMPAVLMVAGELVIAGDASTTLTAGNGSEPASAIEALGGRIVLAPTVTLVPAPGEPPITGAGQVVVRPVASVLATVLPGLLASRLHAPGALQAHTLLSAPPLRVAALPQPLGQLWLAPLHLVVDTGTMPPSGVRTTTLPLPLVPPGTRVVLQAVVVRPDSLELSTPAVLTIDT